MTSVKFVLRPSSKRQSGQHKGSLSLRVIHSRRVKSTTLHCYLYPEEWNNDAQRIVFPENNPARTKYLEEEQEKINQCSRMVDEFIHTLDKQGRYSVEDIISKYRRTKDDGKLLSYVEILATELEKSGQYRTARAYRTVANGLVKFNKNVDIPLPHINACLLKAFEADLKARNKQPNTISYYMRNLRAIYNKAKEAKRIPAKYGNPFTGVYTGVTPTKKRALTSEETTRLYEMDFEALLKQYAAGSTEYQNMENLYGAWRIFFFCFFAQGMCFVDMAYLKKENIKGGVCKYYRKKTGLQIEVPINEGMQKIIDSFSAQVKDSPYVFPILNQHAKNERTQYETALRNQNRRLKKLATLSGIAKRVTTHVSRHSFASIVKGGGISLGVIREMLGHSSETMTNIYLSSFDYSVFNQAYKVITAAIGSPSRAALSAF